jgi:hypothetical protein
VIVEKMTDGISQYICAETANSRLVSDLDQGETIGAVFFSLLDEIWGLRKNTAKREEFCKQTRLGYDT